MYDIIGDIHGHADELELLLQKLEYTNEQGVYRHAERKVIFLGDFIDRGPKVRETLHIVRAMVESGSALAVMGNHEFNFLCYQHQLEDGTWLREHNHNNDKQVKETLSAFEAHPEELVSMMEWFYTLPVFLELDDFRVIHACWQPDLIKHLKTRLVNHRLTPELLIESCTIGKLLFNDLEVVLKGIEVPINPPFHDIEGRLRHEARIRWWLDPKGLSEKDYYFRSSSDQPIPKELENHWFYPMDAKPVFVGHYWMTGTIELASANVCCVDYSIGLKGRIEGAKLVAYRWEQGSLSADRLTFVS